MSRVRSTLIALLGLAMLTALTAAPFGWKKHVPSQAATNAALKPVATATDWTRARPMAGGAGAAAGAAAAEGGALVTKVSFKDLQDFTHDLGYAPTEEKDNDGDRSLLLTMGEVKVAMLLYGKNDEIVSTTLQAHFRMNDTASISLANDWNVKKRYSRAYCEGTRFTLENDLDIEGGVTWNTVSRYLHTFETAASQFTKHIKF